MSLNQIAQEALIQYEKSGGRINSKVDCLAYLMLVTTEVAEAAECVRRDIPDTLATAGKPEGLASEVADIILRALIFAASQNIDVDAAVALKHAYNAKKRPSLATEGKCL